MRLTPVLTLHSGRRSPQVAALSLVLLFAPAQADRGAPLESEPEAELARAEELHKRSDYREAARILNRLRTREDLSAAQRARVLMRLAASQVELGQYEEVFRTAGEAEAPAREAGIDEIRIRLEIVRGAAWRARGFPYRGGNHYENALQLAEQARRDDLRGEILSLLSGVYQELGDWSRTLDYAQRAFEAQENPSDASRFLYLIQRGIAYFEFNDRTRAVEAFENALEIARRTGNRRGESFALGELGLVSWLFDIDFARALERLDRALSLAREIGVLTLEVTWLMNSASVLRDSGDFEAALSRYRQGLALEERSGQRRERPLLLKNLGQALSSIGRYAEAERFLLAALEEADRQNSGKMRWMARMELGGVYRRLGDSPRADRYFGESLDVLEANQSSVLLEGFRVGMLGRALSQYDPYDRYIEFLLERGDGARAFEVAERARARVFLETLTGARAELAAAIPADYQQAETDLLSRITAAQARLRVTPVPPAERRVLVADIEAAEDALTSLRLRLAADRPALSEVRFPRLLSSGEVQRGLLEGDEALVMFFLGRLSSAVWILDRGGMDVLPLPGRNEIEERVRRLLRTLQSPEARPDEGARAWLSRTLVSPITARISEGTRLIVVPHAILSYLPFEVLADNRGRYLVERCAISYAPSVSSLAYLRRRARPASRLGTVLAVGNPEAPSAGAAGERDLAISSVGLLKPLPHSRAEIRRIASMFRPYGRLLEGGGATEEALGSAVRGGTGILHFATHALIDEERPERSGLALSPGPEGSDGILQTREIYGLDLDAALVTLSACRTALGRDVTGEGIVGMSRAFFYAGAGAVASSLWNVGDRSASDLMAAFYQRIHAGAPIDSALAEAKRTFLRDRARQHPYYWAPFIVTGHARAALDFPAAPSPLPGLLLALGLAGLAIAGAIGFRLVRRRGRGTAASS